MNKFKTEDKFIAKYDKKLIDTATNQVCDICKKRITESEANDWKFHYIKTRSGHDVFVHTFCIGKAYGKEGATNNG